MKNKILIEAIPNEQYSDEELAIPSHNEERKTIPPGMSFDRAHFLELNSGLLETLKDQMEDLSNVFSDIMSSDEMELELSLGFTGKGDICILSVNSQFGIRVKMVSYDWINTKNECK